jgi:hypothetical protein
VCVLQRVGVREGASARHSTFTTFGNAFGARLPLGAVVCERSFAVWSEDMRQCSFG